MNDYGQMVKQGLVSDLKARNVPSPQLMADGIMAGVKTTTDGGMTYNGLELTSFLDLRFGKPNPNSGYILPVPNTRWFEN